jgi:hypothetical protein
LSWLKVRGQVLRASTQEVHINSNPPHAGSAARIEICTWNSPHCESRIESHSGNSPRAQSRIEFRAWNSPHGESRMWNSPRGESRIEIYTWNSPPCEWRIEIHYFALSSSQLESRVSKPGGLSAHNSYSPRPGHRTGDRASPGSVSRELSHECSLTAT